MANTPRVTSTPQLASARYVRQFRALLEHQREVFEEERALWHIERSDLQDQISHLEASLRQAQKGTCSQVTSPTSRNGSASSFSSISTASSSRDASTGDEFWRGAGGRGDTRPSRTFSSTSEQSSGSTQRLASISENGTSSLSDTVHRASIPEVDKTSSFDGITFRKSSRAPSTSTNGTTRYSPPPSPSHVSPGTLSLPVSALAPPNAYVTEHAGHTPLARGSIHGTDGTSSDISSATATPTELKKGRPPYEPHASFAKPPSERSDSYFPGALPEPAEDRAMSEPLGLGDGNTSEAQDFLNQVDSKLNEAVRQEQTGPKPQGVGSTPASDALSDPPEHEPPLRIKRSMNFGSQLGGSKGV
ncbi:hypothetical protein G7Y79_00002g006580 [Physcia stellaris]|nr:hypothetical protein G7Y79_00002g006580 [Physcia stellaris]